MVEKIHRRPGCLPKRLFEILVYFGICQKETDIRDTLVIDNPGDVEKLRKEMKEMDSYN